MIFINRNYRHRYLIILAALYSVSASIFAETKEDSTRIAFEVKYHHGIVIPHHTSMTYLIDDYARGTEINIIRQRHKEQLWETYLNRPETGVGFWYSTFGRSDIYGEGFAIYPYINYRLFQIGRLQARYKVALGLGYATKPFKVGENTYNTVFGSHLNAYVGLGLRLHYPITDRFSLSTSFALNHMSNGSSRKPNNGINTAAIDFGLIYELVPFQEPEYVDRKVPADDSREWLFTLGVGRNQAAAYNPTIYWSGSITATHLWYKTRSKAYGIGLDLVKFGGAPYAYNMFQDLDESRDYSLYEELYAGVFGTMESHLGSSSLFMSLGAYIFYKTEPRQPLYARLGIRKKITDQWLAHFGIKANFFTAEFIEFGLGYRLRYR